MLPPVLPLLVVHVIANLVWIGSIASVGMIMTVAADPKVGGQIALSVYRKLSTPAFGISFLAAVALLVHNTQLYFVATKWMHGKLPVALAVIALHHVIGARAKHLAEGKKSTPGPVGSLTLVLLALAAVAAYLAVAKPF
jgi:putative membrane protein